MIKYLLIDQMKITVIGSGYVGLVSGICFAKIGHEVICVDRVEEKILQLRRGEIPIFEPGLKELLDEVVTAKKISFTSNLQYAVENSQAIFIAVGTPQDKDGSADLSYVLAAAKEIAKYANEQKLIVTKSTVPAGCGAKIKELVLQENSRMNFLIASNPEFLREGCAINDFMNPDRIVVGVENDVAKKILQEIYQFFPKEKLVITDIVTAELIKYAANSFLATKIAFINEMANLCEKTNANIRDLSYAIGLDKRIGDKFLNPGPGFGGSCFPKDVLAMLNIGKENQVDLPIADAVINSNEARKINMAKRIVDILDGKIHGKKIALLGLAFKGNTDDIRYSPAIVIASELLKNGANIFAHDYAAIENAKKELTEFDKIEFNFDLYKMPIDTDAIVIATEWNQYSKLDLEKIKTISKCRKIIDLRNLLEEKAVTEAGFEYYCIGKKH